MDYLKKKLTLLQAILALWIGALIVSSGNTVVSDVAKAGLFNEHFAAVGIIDNGVIPHVRTVHNVF